MQIPRNARPATGSRTDGEPATVPDIRAPHIGAHRAAYRAVGTEIQRSTVTGGWTTVAVADDPDWAASITSALSWLETSPAFSAAG